MASRLRPAALAVRHRAGPPGRRASLATDTIRSRRHPASRPRVTPDRTSAEAAAERSSERPVGVAPVADGQSRRARSGAHLWSSPQQRPARPRPSARTACRRRPARRRPPSRTAARIAPPPGIEPCRRGIRHVVVGTDEPGPAADGGRRRAISMAKSNPVNADHDDVGRARAVDDLGAAALRAPRASPGPPITSTRSPARTSEAAAMAERDDVAVGRDADRRQPRPPRRRAGAPSCW